MRTLPRSRSCFVCGVANSLGFRLVMQTDGRIAEARFAFRAEHIGFQQTVHGGLIATILDELMVWACGIATRRFAYCAELTVRYRRPVAPDVEILAQAELLENRRGRLLMARGLLRDPARDLIHAEATGKYIPVDEAMTAAFGEDFVDDPGAILGPEKPA